MTERLVGTAALREQAARILMESVREGSAQRGTTRLAAGELGVDSDKGMRRRVRRTPAVGSPTSTGVPEESAELRRLRAEVRELQKANEILRTALALLAAEFPQPEW